MKGEQRNIQQSIKDAENQIEITNEKIAAERKRLEELHGGAHARRQDELDEKKQALVDLKKRYDDHQNDLARLRANQKDAEDAFTKFESVPERKKQEVQSCEQRIQGLERDRGSLDKAYHEQLSNLLRAINGENSFAERPVGPLGHHVRLRERKWSPVLESAFSDLLTNFVVTSKRDQALLSRIMQRVGW